MIATTAFLSLFAVRRNTVGRTQLCQGKEGRTPHTHTVVTATVAGDQMSFENNRKN